MVGGVAGVIALVLLDPPIPAARKSSELLGPRLADALPFQSKGGPSRAAREQSVTSMEDIQQSEQRPVINAAPTTQTTPPSANPNLPLQGDTPSVTQVDRHDPIPPPPKLSATGSLAGPGSSIETPPIAGSSLPQGTQP